MSKSQQAGIRTAALACRQPLKCSTCSTAVQSTRAAQLVTETESTNLWLDLDLGFGVGGLLLGAEQEDEDVVEDGDSHGT